MRRSHPMLLTGVAVALISIGCSRGADDVTTPTTSSVEPQPPTTTSNPDPYGEAPTTPAGIDLARPLPLSRCTGRRQPVERFPLGVQPAPASGCTDLLLPAWPNIDPFSAPE